MNDIKKGFAVWGLVTITVIVMWVINLVMVIKTVTASEFVWSEISTFVIIQIAAVLVWPVSFVTVPLSFFM